MDQEGKISKIVVPSSIKKNGKVKKESRFKGENTRILAFGLEMVEEPWILRCSPDAYRFRNGDLPFGNQSIHLFIHSTCTYW